MAEAAAGLGSEEPEHGLEMLPSDALLFIFSFLDYRDLVSCSCVSRLFNELSNYDPLWRRHCKRYWLLSEDEKSQENRSWRQLFIDTYIDLGRYVDHYATLKRAWDELERYLGERCPKMIASLNDGAKEWELNSVEARIGCKLPNDYRCSLRIHNGQRLVSAGLMGNTSFFSSYGSENLLDIDRAASIFLHRTWLNQCIPLTFSVPYGLRQYMALESVEGLTKSEIFYHCLNQRPSNASAIELFITGASYSEWFTSYVHNVVTGGHLIIGGQIFKYVRDEGWVATTGDIKVSVSTAFLPECSTVQAPCYFFTYLIRIEMAKDALPDKTCQLDSSYLKMTNSKGEIEEFRHAGVYGEFPIFKSGEVYEYISDAAFCTESVSMEGYYTFHLLENEDSTFTVAIPRFQMVSPTFKVSRARSRNQP